MEHLPSLANCPSLLREESPGVGLIARTNAEFEIAIEALYQEAICLVEATARVPADERLACASEVLGVLTRLRCLQEELVLQKGAQKNKTGLPATPWIDDAQFAMLGARMLEVVEFLERAHVAFDPQGLLWPPPQLPL